MRGENQTGPALSIAPGLFLLGSSRGGFLEAFIFDGHGLRSRPCELHLLGADGNTSRLFDCTWQDSMPVNIFREAGVIQVL